MDLEDVETRLFARRRKLDLAIDATRSEQSRVENVDTVGGHDDLDVLLGLEAVELVEQLQHSALYFTVTARATLDTRRADRVDLVHEDDGRRVLARHHEQLADHARALADELLHELAATHAYKRALGVMGDGASEQRLAGAGRSVEEHALGLRDAERLEQLGMLDGQLDDLLDLLDLLVQTADHLVRRVGHLLDHHQAHERVDLVRQYLVQQVAVVLECHARIRRYLGYVDVLVDVDHELALRVHLDEHLLLVHRLDDLAHVRALLL